MFRSRRRPADARTVEVRSLVVEAVLQNPLAAIADPEAIERLHSGRDVTFDALGLDSLARLTLAIDLDRHGFAVAEDQVTEAGSIDALTALLLTQR